MKKYIAFCWIWRHQSLYFDLETRLCRLLFYTKTLSFFLLQWHRPGVNMKPVCMIYKGNLSDKVCPYVWSIFYCHLHCMIIYDFILFDALWQRLDTCFVSLFLFPFPSSSCFYLCIASKSHHFIIIIKYNNNKIQLHFLKAAINIIWIHEVFQIIVLWNNYMCVY